VDVREGHALASAVVAQTHPEPSLARAGGGQMQYVNADATKGLMVALSWPGFEKGFPYEARQRRSPEAHHPQELGLGLILPSGASPTLIEVLIGTSSLDTQASAYSSAPMSFANLWHESALKVRGTLM